MCDRILNDDDKVFKQLIHFAQHFFTAFKDSLSLSFYIYIYIYIYIYSKCFYLIYKTKFQSVDEMWFSKLKQKHPE